MRGGTQIELDGSRVLSVAPGGVRFLAPVRRRHSMKGTLRKTEDGARKAKE
ncbi:MAG: hypothetical protein MI923_30335 [Phycisphaerales bacterium]|nr:hypothetical protein [Phycisphaerales bacterium]